MIGVLTLASYGLIGGGSIGNFLFQLENLGVFSYVLPFLMIFAVVYAILSKTSFLGKSNAVNVILSLAVGFMALQFDFVPYFFSEIFPRMGVLLSIILVAIILIGLFFDFRKKGTKVFFGILALIGFIVIVLQSFSEAFPWGGNLFSGSFWWWLEDHLAIVLTIALVIIGVAAVVWPRKGPDAQRKGFKITDFVTDESAES